MQTTSGAEFRMGVSDAKACHSPGYLGANYMEGYKTVKNPGINVSTKNTNPKDAVGTKKAPISTLSGAVIAELGVAMLEGARKYGRHNYRIDGVRASVYRDAAFRHLNKWWEGEDDDPDSGLNHIIKAIASLAVLRDSMIIENWVDDRPPTMVPVKFFKDLDEQSAAIVEKYPNALPAFIKGDEKKDEKND